MIKIKLKRKLWFYPHRCPDCGEVLVFTEHYDQVRCRKCGKKQQRRNKAARPGSRGFASWCSLNKRQADKFGINYGMVNPNGAKELLKKVEEEDEAQK